MTGACPGHTRGPEGAIRVGIFPFEPFNYIDQEGKPQGLNTDLLREIVSDEPLSIKYVQGSWAEGLQRLENEEIDLMMSVAYTEDRSKVMDYTYESVAELWGQVFLLPGSSIKKIQDLSGKTVAVMNRDISGDNFRKTAAGFGVACIYLEFPTHHDVFKAVQQGLVSAGVAPQHFGLRHTDQYDLAASTIMFSPFSIYFTAKKGRHPELLSSIDAHLNEWKRQENSFYYECLDYWLGLPPPRTRLSKWLGLFLVIVVGITLILLVFTLTLRRTVATRTKELRETEERYRRFINLANEGIIAVDGSKRIDFANPRMAEMLGYTVDQLIGKPAKCIMFAADYPEHDERMELRARGEGQKYELRMKSSDGSERWMLVGATPLKDETGEPAGSFAMVTDITERKLAEKELKELHGRLLTILDSIDSTIYVADFETDEILFMNKYMVDLFGADLTGKTCWSGLRDKTEPCSFCNNATLLDENGEPVGVKIREDRHPVTKRWNIYRDKAIKWVDGRMARIQVATDLTQIKEFELRQQEYERSLHQTQRLETVGTLAGGIAHDFNNILSSIIGYTEIALDDELEDDSPGRDCLENVLKASRRAKDLIKRLLIFSRQGGSEIQPMKITEVLSETMNMVRATLPSNIEVKLSIEVQDDVVLGDPTTLHQVIMNLCSNGAYAMRQDGGILAADLFDLNEDDIPIQLSEQRESGSFIVLTISDTGTGMPREMLPKIFDPFFTTKPKEEGTGLGLSVTHGIIQDLGGAISVESDYGKGTVFSLYLPIAGKSIDDIASKDEQGGHGSERILLVDDEPALVKMYQRSLEGQGYIVSSAPNAQEALKIFECNPENFDMVVTDQTMPGMTGDKLSAELLAVRPNLPIILYTGYSNTIDENRARLLGISEFLFKPVSVRELAKVIRQLLDDDKKRT